MSKYLKYILFAFIVSSFSITILPAQLDLEITVDEYADDTLYLGYYYGNKKYFYDTAISENGKFTIHADTSAPEGMYLLLNKDLRKYHDLILEEDQVFEIRTDSSFQVDAVTIKGSGINEDFYGYIKMISALKPKADELQSQMPDPEIQAKLEKLNKQVVDRQKALIEKYPGSILAATIRSNIEMEIPDFEGSEQEVNLKKYRYFKKHYFDEIDLGNEKYIRAPFFFPYVDRYIKKVVPQHPDSIIEGLDLILEPMLESQSDAFKFYLVHYLNYFARSKVVGMDAVYVHLVNKYYKTGKAWWTDEEQLKKIEKEVAKIEPTLIGKTAPDITIKKLNSGESFSLHGVNSPYTILFFWDPECGHCKESMPEVIDFYKKYQDKGIAFIAVCTKLNQDAQSKCMEFINEKEGMDLFTNAYDPFLSSRYKQKYDVRSTPRVFILDKDKEILMKNFPVEKLPEVMDQIMSADQSVGGQKLK